MKILKPIIIILVVITIIILIFASMGKTQQMVVVHEGNRSKQAVPMIPGKFQGSECGMVINDLNFASQVVAPNGKTWFFDDHGCMAAWIKAKPFAADAVIWVNDLTSGTWIDGRKAWYSQTDQTPMSYGFGAYATYADSLIDFASMQEHMLKGETLANLNYRKQLLEK